MLLLPQFIPRSREDAARDIWRINFLTLPNWDFEGAYRGPVGTVAQLAWRSNQEVGCALGEGATCWTVVCV